MHSPLNATLGIRTIDNPDGTSSLELETDARFHNEVGILHGGITMLLLDGAMGRTVGRSLAEGEGCGTVQFSNQFLEPAMGRLRASARIVRRGQRLAFVEGECFREDGKLIARAQGTWAIFRLRREAPGA